MSTTTRTTRINGVVPVIPIPFDEAERIDEPCLRRAIDFAATNKMAAICLPAYGSEFYKLADDERHRVVEVAIDQTKRRLPVIAQANHASAKIAAETAARYEKLGADLISIALPRQFPVTEADLLCFSGRVADAISCELLVQDFNPGGPTVGAEFLATLQKQHPNVTYAKLEEPLIIDKLRAIRDRIGESLRLLTGWGGMYLLEGLEVGSCGVMPGLAICDLIDRVFRTRDAALFAQLLPYITFQLQSFELFHLMEKRLLVRRGVFDNARVRDVTRTPAEAFSRYADRLIEQIISLTL
jgi:4-hydroxy-tetrahydrodipicolinate synthase